jgi:hypothetical protein
MTTNHVKSSEKKKSCLDCRRGGRGEAQVQPERVAASARGGRRDHRDGRTPPTPSDSDRPCAGVESNGATASGLPHRSGVHFVKLHFGRKVFGHFLISTTL